MDEVILLSSEDSENSIIEVEVPKRVTPPLIDILDDDIILNIKKDTRETFLAKDIIENEELTVVMHRSNSTLSKNLNPYHWTSEMIKFYNDDWGDEEHFVVEKIQEKMDKTPSLWEISHKDILFMKNKLRRNNVRCWNCSQHGHTGDYCPEPPYVPKCHMCGTPGHVENNCPNSKCLNCGNPARQYVTCCINCRKEIKMTCTRCHLRGHHFINCSDHWRLFHLTTDSNFLTIPDNNVNKPAKELWCCNCGRRGHLHNQCIKKNAGGFPDMHPLVISYERSFNDNSCSKNFNNKKNYKNGIPHKKFKRNHNWHESMPQESNPKSRRKEKFQFKKKFNKNKKKKKADLQFILQNFQL